MNRARLALKKLSSSKPEAFWDRERPPRSPDDPGFQEEIDDLTDPPQDETFFRSTLYAWTLALFGMLLVSLPFLFLIWRFRGVLSVLDQALGGVATSSGVP
jgi:hypothetical protein